ncbi:MAG TPA: hypothetical protein VK249_00730 [Anaerolineales bacterium]|nr:hypothetical protein [Anaerolineales bacterium]
MAKIFYTERDIDDLKARGINSIDVNENVVMTDLAVERAMKNGIKINRREQSAPQATLSPSVNTYAAYPRETSGASASDLELKQKIKSAVLARLNGQVDEALLEAVIARVLAGMK